ncbi:outer membrane beta-barrel protein [Helicobacter sp. 11S03491-1]|uniref:outer membrane beta-barrel protein n=1 Tax=Helicobacter sp. 11S03491-1 TaxID=1476196 RepID=UPI000BA5B056|nr:outer membrane beta-barrel protein [Helicobacter sp. 11S03491-1]PAF41732.1 hypothetical protein BKH45_06495 [Helicobacter sp. 11S03491-1]
MKNIKKALVIAGCALSLGASTALAENTNVRDQSGIFAGLEIGSSLGYGSSSTREVNGVAFTETFTSGVNSNMLYGARIGYQQYFNAYNGLRLYGTFDYSNFSPPLNPKVTANFFKYGVSLDYLINFSDTQNPWGIFVGAGYQWVQSKSFVDEKKIPKDIHETKKITQDGIIINAGISKIINNHNRLELGVKVPLYNYIKYSKSENENEDKATLRNPADIYLAYSYSF